jgi:uncharacterized membrane protein HdeD (DUF308 family)
MSSSAQSPITGSPMLGSEDPAGIMRAIGRNWWVLLFVGVVSIIAGIILMARPAGSTWVLAVILAVYLVISGIFSLVRAFSPGLSGSFRAILIIGGLIGLLLGLLMFRFGPEEKIEILGIFVGVWFLFSGVSSLFAAGAVEEGRGWQIFNGVVYLIAGIALLAVPYAVEIFVWVAGIWLVVLGIFEVINSFMIKSAAKKLTV